MKSFFLIVVVFSMHVFLGPELHSQMPARNTAKPESNSYAQVGLHYLSDAVFLGRKDTVTAPYLFSTIEYHHTLGLYVEGSASYLTKSDTGRFDLFLLTAGYEKDFGKLSADASFTKYFFNADSYNVISAAEADISAQFIYDLDILNLGLASSLMFSSDSTTDLFLFTNVGHDFLSADGKWQFSPALELQFGSQQFYEQYLIAQTQKGEGGSSGNGNGSGNGSGGNGDPIEPAPTIKITESESFNLMAIEVSAPIWYRLSALTFTMVPTYVIPTSESEVWVNDAMVKENIESTFYWMLGASYRF